MKRTNFHSLDPSSARKKIAMAKADKPVMAALLDRDHRGHWDAVDQWSRLHEAAFPEPISSVGINRKKSGDRALSRNGATSIRQDTSDGERRAVAQSKMSLRPAKSRLQDTAGTTDRRTSGAVSEGPGETELPVVNMEADRIQVLIDDAPARFEIEDNPNANPNYGKWRAIPTLGVLAVRRNAGTIEREAEAQGVDADLVKAILYVERAQGYHDLLHEATGEAESHHPMNIKPDPWSAIESSSLQPTSPIRKLISVLPSH